MQNRMKDTASYAGHAAAAGGYYATRQLDRQIHSFPLIAMGGALLAGFAVGMMLPETRKENELLGPYRDSMIDESWTNSEALMNRGKQALSSSAAAAMDEIKRQGLTPDGMKEKAEHIAERARHEAQEAAEEEGLSGKGLQKSVQQVAKASKDAAKDELKGEKKQETQS